MGKDPAAVKAVDESRIAFVHSLRGVATLLVLWAHLSGWWLTEAGRSSVLLTSWIDLVCRPLHLHQNGGHLGVLLFFLVSGFIITHVAQRESRPEFLIKRFFRLTPTMLLAVFVLPVLTWCQALTGLPEHVMGNQSNHYLQGALLLNYFAGAPQVLTVLWTLFVEILFYALTAAFLSLSHTNPHRATWCMLAVPYGWHVAGLLWPSFQPAMWGVMYLPYLLVGRCIYLGWSKQISPLQSVTCGLASYGTFVVLYHAITGGLLTPTGGEPVISQLYGIVIFLAVAAAALQSTPRWLAFIANISYPLYLLHAPLGGFLLFFLTKHGLAYETALVPTISLLLLAAYLVHRWLEIPMQGVARKLCARLRAPRTDASTPLTPR